MYKKQNEIQQGNLLLLLKQFENLLKEKHLKSPIIEKLSRYITKIRF